MNTPTPREQNVIIVSLAFWLIFTGNLTIIGTSGTILRAFEDRTGHSVNGFITIGLSYAFSFISTPFLPLLISFIGNKRLLILGGVFETVFMKWSLIGSVTFVVLLAP